MAHFRSKIGRIHQQAMSIMKRFSTYKFIAAVLTAGVLVSASAITTAAQEYVSTPVTVSTNKLKVDGKVCYSHIVQERQTIYSICKAYNVTAEDIYKLNPGLEENGLKKNAIIIIPAAVEAKEIAEEPQKVSTSKHLKHTVKWYETDVKDIAEKYGVSAESIMQLNQLTSTTLTTRQKLLIPDPETQYASAEAETAPVEKTDTAVVAEKEKAPLFAPKDDVTFGLVLPLAATGTSSKRSYMDFYSGVLMAIYDCSQNGIGVDLRVHDIADGNLPEEGFTKDCDFVVGPIFKDNITKVLDARTDDVVIISPLDHKADPLIDQYNAFIQAPSSRNEQFRDLVNWIQEEMGPEDRVIYINESNARDTAAVSSMTKILNESGIVYSKFSYNILQGRSITNPLLAKMTTAGVNRFIIESESEAWVNDVVRNINLLKKGGEVVLYSPSKIRTFETIEADYFHNINLRVSLSYNINYDSEEVRQFIMKYRALFMTEPTQFAYQGYDLTTYFLNLVHKYGDNWLNKLTEEEGNMLQATLKFAQQGNGYMNVGIRRIQYMPDGSVINVK